MAEQKLPKSPGPYFVLYHPVIQCHLSGCSYAIFSNFAYPAETPKDGSRRYPNATLRNCRMTKKALTAESVRRLNSPSSGRLEIGDLAVPGLVLRVTQRGFDLFLCHGCAPCSRALGSA